MPAALVFCEESLTEEGTLPLRGRPGVSRITEEAYAAGWLLAVVSSSPYAQVENALEHAVGYDRAKDFAVFVDETAESPKPAPDIYLLALEHLNVGAADVVAVESSENGFVAAHAAGLRTVVITEDGTDGLDDACLVVTTLGDDETRSQVLHDPLDLQVKECVSIQDLSRILTLPRS